MIFFPPWECFCSSSLSFLFLCFLSHLSAFLCWTSADACSSGVTPEMPAVAALDSLGSPRREEGLWTSPGSCWCPGCQSLSTAQHADELCINGHNIPLVLTAVLCQESQMKAALFVEMPIWKLCLGVRAFPAADRQGPRYPCSHQLHLREEGAVRKRGYCSPNNIAVFEEQIRELWFIVPEVYGSLCT